jgi:hypothetical protein
MTGRGGARHGFSPLGDELAGASPSPDIPLGEGELDHSSAHADLGRHAGEGRTHPAVAFRYATAVLSAPVVPRVLATYPQPSHPIEMSTSVIWDKRHLIGNAWLMRASRQFALDRSLLHGALGSVL